MGHVEQTSVVAVDAHALWARATSAEGVNEELGPVLRMTVPRGAGELNVDTAPIGVPIGRSWLLLFGVIPVDYDHLMIADRDELRFLEQSTMGSLRRWQHERALEPLGPDRCRVTDRLTFEPRIPGTDRLATAIVRATFRHRHRRLARRYGT